MSVRKKHFLGTYMYNAWISLSETRHSMHYILALTTCNLEKWTDSNAGTFHLCDSW